MKFIYELLKDEKVEWKKLGEVCEFRRGAFPQPYGREEWYGGVESMPFIQVADMNDDDTMLLNEETKNKISKIAQSKSVFATKGTVLCSIQGTIGRVALSQYDAYIDRTIAIFYNYKVEINKKYFSYILKKIFNIKKKHARGSTLKTITKEEFKDFKIPIPSLEIQEKIVKILDNFTKYVTELQAELQARNKQYNYYRDMLLSENYLNKISKKLNSLNNENDVLRLTTLGEIGKFTRGNGLQKKDFREKGKPVIHYGQIYTQYSFSTENTISFTEEDIFSKLRKAKPNDILIATTSENIEDVAKSTVWLGNEEVGFSGDMYSYSTNENSKYIAYYFQTAEFQKQKERKVTGTKLIRIHGEDIEKFTISLPPIEIQNKIVKILDRFQEILSDTKGLLPLEIEQRRKQYEYYREKLLTFNKEERYALSTEHGARSTEHGARSTEHGARSTATNNE